MRRHVDRDQVAINRARRGAGADRKLAAELFFVDRDQPGAAVGRLRKMPSTRCLARSISLMTRPVISSSRRARCE